jgi:type VI secretion system protein ImpA
MSIELTELADPLPGDHPAGRDCGADIDAQNLAVLREFLVERALQKMRERMAEQPGLDEGERRQADSDRDDGKRKLAALEPIVRDVLEGSSAAPEQVAGALRDRAEALLRRAGKDLRLVPLLASACLCTQGLAGYAACVQLAAHLLRAYPDTLFPLPDPDEAEPTWMRAGAVAELLAGEGTLALLQAAVVTEGASGRITLGELAGGLRLDLPPALVADDALAQAAGGAQGEGARRALRACTELAAAVRALAQAFAGRLPPLRISAALQRACARLAVAAGVSAPDGVDGARAGAPGADGAPAPANAMPIARAAQGAAPQTREDARRAIQDVIRFMEAHEPGHPAPLLLRRADRLLGLSFVEIIRDVAPTAVAEVEKLAGANASR